MTTQMVAALFVDPKGPYMAVNGVDPWTERRDARLYTGPFPVVAHPPCNRWVNLAAVNFKRYGGEHNRPGNDGGCFAAALIAVRRWGGVLEHPAGSHAWEKFGLLRPGAAPAWYGPRNSHGVNEWTTEVWQSAYGHKARKRTWLLYVGSQRPPQIKWDRKPGTHQIGWFDRNKPTLGKAEASRTPVAFAEELIRLARGAV